MLIYMLLGLLLMVCITKGEKLNKNLESGYEKYKKACAESGEDAASAKAYRALIIAGLMFVYVCAWPVLMIFLVAKKIYKSDDTDKGTPA